VFIVLNNTQKIHNKTRCLILCSYLKVTLNKRFIKYAFTLFYKMKQKLSITIEEETIELLDSVIKNGVFRNKSHAIEFSLNKTLKEKENE